MIQQHTSSGLSIEALCGALDVSVSGYYAWRERGPILRRQADEQLGQAITRVFQASRQTYVSHRVYQALRQDGLRTSRKRVARLIGVRLAVGARSQTPDRADTGGTGRVYRPQPSETGLQRRASEREVGDRHDLYPNPRGLVVSGQCDRFIQPAGGRLGDG
jgi:hypothetical protein